MANQTCPGCYGSCGVTSVPDLRRVACHDCDGLGKVTPEKAAEIIQRRQAAMKLATAMPTYTGRSVRVVSCG